MVGRVTGDPLRVQLNVFNTALVRRVSAPSMVVLLARTQVFIIHVRVGYFRRYAFESRPVAPFRALLSQKKVTGLV